MNSTLTPTPKNGFERQYLKHALSDTSSVAPVVPDDAPFNDSQRHWLNGLLTGLSVLARAAAQQQTPPASNNARQTSAAPLTILYGSQSGASEALSKDLRKQAVAIGLAPSVRELNDVGLAELSACERLLIVCSTFGEGDPPDNAAKFFSRIMAADAPRLTGLAYSVCGMGDSSYTHFNKAARDLDARLEALGAMRIAQPAFCDVDHEDDYAAWKKRALSEGPWAGAHGAPAPAAHDTSEPVERYDKNNPFAATVLDVQRLSAPTSAKEVNHIELSLAGSGLSYDVGDALGLWPVNCEGLIDALLRASGLSGREVVTLKTGHVRLRAAMVGGLDLCTLTAKALETLHVPADADTQGMHLLDVIERFGLRPSAQELVDAMRPLQPRLYSISSSPRAHPGEVHLTVAAVRYDAYGRPRKGVASTYLADHCRCGVKVGVYVQKSAHFHLPGEDVPLVMIGPGTGVAPFRAFLEEREARGVPTRNWLFFGDQHAAEDFLYRDQIEQWLSTGVLERFEAAWSRDQPEKVYVQHLMAREGKRLWDWLEAGAAVYVCGDASRMARDVDAALHAVVAEHGRLSAEQAGAYVDRLKQSHRYQRDVY